MSRKRVNKLLAAVVFAGLLCGCKPKVNDFINYENIDPSGWKYGEKVTFHPEQTDSCVEGRLDLALRHTNDYPYRNLWLEVTSSDSVNTRIDTVNILLSDVYGNWYGTGIGTDFQIEKTIADSLKFFPPISIDVRHIMRVDNLEGVEQIGVTFTEY